MVYNFAAGPAMLPIPVMQRVQEEFLNWKNMGISVIEISHRSKEFEALVDETDQLFRQVTGLPDNYEILYCHGGAQMQFSMVPMNLIHRKPGKKALYVETGNFAKIARVEAEKFGNIKVVATGVANNYASIPSLEGVELDEDASYLYLTSNNTLFGTRWDSFPDTGEIPLVVDATSEILGRRMDYSKFGVLFAGTQKNLGPSGLAMVVARKDLIGHALADCPKLMDYAVYQKEHSMANTPNTFAIYMIRLVLEWLRDIGGVDFIEQQNAAKAKLLYDYLDSTDFYRATALPGSRSHMNVCFHLPSEELLQTFVKEAEKQGLYALKGHRMVGGARASLYNAMPIEGVQALVNFMREFARTRG